MWLLDSDHFRHPTERLAGVVIAIMCQSVIPGTDVEGYLPTELGYVSIILGPPTHSGAPVAVSGNCLLVRASPVFYQQCVSAGGVVRCGIGWPELGDDRFAFAN